MYLCGAASLYIEGVPMQGKQTVQVNIRSFGEFLNHRKVTISLPASFDLEDKSTTKPIYEAWNKGKNVPESNPHRHSIDEVKKSLKLHEMMLTSRNGQTYISVIGETRETYKPIVRKLNAIFGEDNLTFDIVWASFA